MYRTHYKWVPMVGLSLGIAALLAIAWDPKMPVLGVIALLAVVGIAIGSCYPVGTVSVQNACARHQVGIAMGKFHGVMIPATPTGTRMAMLNLLGSSDGTVWPKSRRPSAAA